MNFLISDSQFLQNMCLSYQYAYHIISLLSSSFHFGRNISQTIQEHEAEAETIQEQEAEAETIQEQEAEAETIQE